MVKKTTTTAPAPKLDPTIRVLEKVAVINNSSFDTASLVKRTEILSRAEGKQVLFVHSFADLASPKKLIDAMASGAEDVELRLEFNSIELSENERNGVSFYLSVVQRIKERLGSTGYQYLEEDELTFGDIFTMYDNHKIVLRDGYSNNNNRRGMTKLTARKVWKFASFCWHNGMTYPNQPNAVSGLSGSWLEASQRRFTVTHTGVKIGCTNLTRREVEIVARHFNWEPTLEVK